MFRSRRSTLVRRLWRSRLVTDSEGRDGGKRAGGDQDGSYGRDAEDSHSGAERRPVTREVRPLGTVTGEAHSGHLGDGVAQEGYPSEHERGGMCVPEHRCSRRGQDSDGRTVTCCVFREWNLRPRRPYSALRKDGGGSSCRCCPRHKRLEGNTLGEQELKNMVHALLKRLRENHLEALLKAIETKGGHPGECVMMPQSDADIQSAPPFLLCKLYRWNDLQPSAQLKVLCHCKSFHAVDSAQVCCNPYHYSRLCGPESPPPPYSVSHSDAHKPLESTQSYTETVPLHHNNHPQVPPRDYTDTGTSIGSTTSVDRRSQWCSVAYWEQRTRVGRLYAAREPSLGIFYDLPQGTGLCLGQLHADAYQRRRRRGDGDGDGDSDPDGEPAAGADAQGARRGGVASGVRQVRDKIGHGIALSQEADGVWVYNRSQHPVFVHSPTLDLPGARGGLTVRRVVPGYSLKVFDYERSGWMEEHGVKPEGQEGPWDPRSVRISFAKGWGPCYSRQFITSCPCWLEVLLSNHR
ncbi:mothers against decapentaplegic homolog 6-like [Gadus morhua]|uniref:Mothers against decapentaplegic homolog n=1 Tax=Gadus morhua TaxID=8049 RepID=A0A8C5A7T9_GADMO|nr:mothers against decapentaplegic homolog 6-like [Gadus morhua]